jgi:restriction endonuclease S subunit
VNNITDGKLDLSDLKFVKLKSRDQERLLLNDNDILFNRTNSKELVGKCAVFHESGDYVFASYLIRIRPDPTKADSDFVAYVINSSIGRQQINAISRQIIGQANVNSEELRSLQIPLPPLDVQKEIMRRVEEGRSKIRQEQEAAAQVKEESEREVERMILGLSKA